ncbi:MAG: hypothetical protein HQ448_09995 [Cytophagales bacterium]|nr:hypothetical protein [Cytophagales bacterium]
MKFITICVLLLYSTWAFADFEFMNSNHLKMERIDFKSKKYSQELQLNHWEVLGDVEFQSVNLADLPPKYIYNTFEIKGHFFFVISGTGQVYEFDPLKRILSRVDQTFYRGYNFGALQFSHKDSLFSFGGIGFWHYNNVLTFFDFQTKEWELVKPKGEMPNRIYTTFSGYSKREGKLFMLEIPDAFVSSSILPLDFYEYDLKSYVWSKKGSVSVDFLNSFEKRYSEAIWVNDLFIISSITGEIIVDPIKNKCYKYLGSKTSFFIPGFKVFAKGNMLYSYKKDFPEKSNKNYLDSLDIRVLMSQSEEIGPFYTAPSWINHEWYLYLIFSVIFLVSLLFNLKYFKNWRKLKVSFLKGGDLSPEALSFLDKCLALGVNHTLTSHEITYLMGYDNQSYDTQRQYRSKLINHINAHFKNNYNIPNVIVRISSNSDKRFVDYVISPHDFQKIREIVNM